MHLMTVETRHDQCLAVDATWWLSLLEKVYILKPNNVPTEFRMHLFTHLVGDCRFAPKMFSHIRGIKNQKVVLLKVS